MSKKNYSPNDLIEFENHNRNSSFGKKLLSNVQNSPSFGFGSSSRYQASQIYRENKLMEKGKHSPGPIYNPSTSYNKQLPRAPAAQLGTSKRKSLNNTSYDHYARQDVDFEPEKADSIRKWSAGSVRFGQEQRFKQKEITHTPGPNYDIEFKENGPKYTMGNKRPHSTSLSTPNNVGPGSYKPQKEQTTEIAHQPKYSFTTAAKMPTQPHWDRNQTYFVGGSVGSQVSSRKPSKPSYSFGKGVREARIAVSKQDFDRMGIQVRIPHPKF